MNSVLLFLKNYDNKNSAIEFENASVEACSQHIFYHNLEEIQICMLKLMSSNKSLTLSNMYTIKAKTISKIGDKDIQTVTLLG